MGSVGGAGLDLTLRTIYRRFGFVSDENNMAIGLENVAIAKLRPDQTTSHFLRYPQTGPEYLECL
jgi:hypothetical protein